MLEDQRIRVITGEGRAFKHFCKGNMLSHMTFNLRWRECCKNRAVVDYSWHIFNVQKKSLCVNRNEGFHNISFKTEKIGQSRVRIITRLT